MTSPLDETAISLEAGSASSLNVSLDVSAIGKKGAQCPGVPLPIGLQPNANPVVSLFRQFMSFLN